MLNFQIFPERRSQVPFKHRLGGSEVLDIPLVSYITEVNGWQVILSLKVHSNDALAVKTPQILACHNIDVLQSALIIKLFPPLDDEPVGLQFKGCSKGTNT